MYQSSKKIEFSKTTKFQKTTNKFLKNLENNKNFKIY